MEEIKFTKDELLDLMLECYSSWISYWQLIMEQEREQEELFDAFNWSFKSKKFAMPSYPIERRQLYSENWFNVKTKESKNIYTLIKKFIK